MFIALNLAPNLAHGESPDFVRCMCENMKKKIAAFVCFIISYGAYVCERLLCAFLTLKSEKMRENIPKFDPNSSFDVIHILR